MLEREWDCGGRFGVGALALVNIPILEGGIAGLADADPIVTSSAKDTLRVKLPDPLVLTKHLGNLSVDVQFHRRSANEHQWQ